ncbi:MAG: general secretion pathway protein K [Halioglobus sp.]
MARVDIQGAALNMKTRQTQTGVALAIVVWFLAAMSLMVSGIVFQAKVDTRMAQLHVAKAKAVAAGDGAIALMLAAVVAGTAQQAGEDQQLPPMDFVLGPYEVNVRLVPVSGLIDLNSASAKLLATLFEVHGGLTSLEAQILGDSVVKWRSTQGGQNSRPARYSAIEDLLRVEGVNRGLLDGIRDSVAVGSSRRSNVDWASAPASVLAVMERHNPDKAGQQQGRSIGQLGSNNNNGRATMGSMARSGRLGSYRVDAIVRVGDQLWLRRRWAAGGVTGAGKLPWRFVRTEPPRVLHSTPLARHT